MLSAVVDVLSRVVEDVWGAVAHNWPYLLISVLVATALSVWVGTDRLAAWLRRRRWTAITGAVLLATFTPFCSCGTTAVVLGMLATRTPWAPIVAFMVASPLTSPSELMLSAGLFGWSFALVYFIGATGLGFAAGGVTGLLEDRGLLAGQARMTSPAAGCGSCGAPEPVAVSEKSSPGQPNTPPGAARSGAVTSGTAPLAESLPAGAGGCSVSTCTGPDADPPVPARPLVEKLRLRELASESWRMGRQMLLYFLGFSAIAYLVLELLPANTLVKLLGGDSPLHVPLAALLGIPVYITSEGSLPMVAALMNGGLGAGVAMAFLITGAGTSIPAISGVLVIARRRVVGLVVGLLFIGAVLLGWFTTAVLG